MMTMTGNTASILADTLGEMWDQARTSVVWSKLAKAARKQEKRAFALHLAEKCNGDATSLSYDAERLIREACKYERDEREYRAATLSGRF